MEVIRWILRLLILIPAIISLTDILVWQDIARPLRSLAGIEHDDGGKRIGHDDSFTANLLWCPRCTGVWAAGILVALILYVTPAYDFIGGVLATSLLADEIWKAWTAR